MRTFTLRTLAITLGLSMLVASNACFAAGPKGTGPRDFSFKDEPLEAIFGEFAEAGGFSVAVAPEVAKAKMVVRLKQVEPLDALFLVAKIQELRVRRDPAAFQAGVLKYIVSRPDKIEKSYQFGNSRTFKLRTCRANDVRNVVLKRLGKDANIAIETDTKTNLILLRAPEELLSRAISIVWELERSASLSLPVGTGRASVVQGSVVTDPLTDSDLSGI